MQSLTKIFISAFFTGSFVRNNILLFSQTFHWKLQYHILQEIIKVASRFTVICSGNSRLTAISQMMLDKDKMSNFILQAKQTWQSIVTNQKMPFPCGTVSRLSCCSSQK